MKTDRFQRPIPISSMAALAGWLVIFTVFGGTALAASAPTITKITQKDTNGTPDTSDDKVIRMATGYEANKVTVDGQSNIYATDVATGIIYKFNSNGHLTQTFQSVYRPLSVAALDKYDAETNKIVTTVLAAGNSNGYWTVFMMSQAGTIKGYLRRLPADIEPMSFGIPGNVAVDSSGNIYVVDNNQNIVQMFDKDGVFVKTFGPYPEQSSDKYFSSELIGTTIYYRTKHTLLSLAGVAIANGELYIAFDESVDYLTTTSDLNCVLSATDSRCYPDTESSYSNYPNTSSVYNNWYSLGEAQVVAVIDLSTKQLKRKITVYPFAKSGSSGSSYRINDIAADNSGRLYVATNSEFRVFDVAVNNRIDISTPLTVSGFSYSNYMGVAYDNKYNRLLVTGGDTVSLYGIDCPAGICPKSTNNAPEAPVLISPVSTYASTLSPSLDVKNAIDPEADPLIYSYEIKDSNGALISSSGNITEGTAGMTYMPVNATLIENSLYRWRALSFDGNLSTWSAGEWETHKNNWAEFCVNAQNDKPETPVLTNPESGASVSPFSSYFAWSPSKDPDCYDTVSYTVEISGDPYFGSLLSSRAVSNQSVKLGDITTGLANGSTYYWRVKAVDNNGGESGYSAGSLVYKTTSARFESVQQGTKVYIDGNYGYLGRLLGTAGPSTPLEVFDITPGSHFVAFVRAGYEPYNLIVEVKDPLIDDNVAVISAGSDKWVKAARIRPSASGTELFKINGGNSTPFVVDFNDDGLKDIVTGGVVKVYNENGDIIDIIDGRVYLYLSEVQADGTSKLAAKGTLWADGSEINVGLRAVPFVVDYDNDGKKDLLVGSGDGLIYLYKNTGTDSAPVFASAGTLKDRFGDDIKVLNSAPVVVDYNNDGRKDLVVGGSDGKLRLYKNRARSDKPELDDAYPEFDAIYDTIKADNSDSDLNAGSNAKVFFADWNSDGKKDMVVGGSTLNLFLNVGTDAAPDFKSIAALQDWIKGKKKERGNREFIPYLGYNQDLTDVAGVSTDVAPFVLNWDGSAARDIITGAADGTAISHVTPE